MRDAARAADRNSADSGRGRRAESEKAPRRQKQGAPFEIFGNNNSSNDTIAVMARPPQQPEGWRA